MTLIHLPVHGIESIIDFFENTVVRFVTNRIACTLNSGMVELLIRFIVESVVLLRHSWGRALFKLSNFCQNRGWIQYNLHIILFCDDWRMRQMDCFNEPTGKQFPTLGPLEIWFLELNIFVESHNFHKIKFSTNVFLAFSNTFFKYT